MGPVVERFLDLEPVFVDVAVACWERFTERKAERVRGVSDGGAQRSGPKVLRRKGAKK